MKFQKFFIILLIGLIFINFSSSLVSSQYSNYNNVAMGITGMICFLYFLIYSIPSLIFIIIIYKDAMNRGASGIYALLGFLWLLGLILWLVVRPARLKKQSDRRCPHCGRIIPEDAMVCPYCGKNFKA